MAMTINTNFASMNAQRNLLGTQNSLNTSLQRLSTGLRINSAKDDAAGLQIANRMTSQINGLNVAKRNANDGISMAQTAEGALQEYTNILHRMRDLGVQAKNGTNSESDRAALNKEFQQMKKELDRIADTTTYGKGENLFEKLEAGVDFQVGADVDSKVLTADDVKEGKLSKYDVQAAVEAGLAELGLGTSEEDLKKLDAVSKITTKLKTETDGQLSNDINLTDLGVASKEEVESVLADLGIGATVAQGSDSTKVKITLKTGDKDALGKLDTLATALKENVDMTKGELKDINQGEELTALQSAMEGLGKELKSHDPNVISVKVDSATLDTEKLGDIATADDAGKAMEAIDAMIDAVGSIRADLGATQNRFQSTINNLGNIAENMAVAKGRIMDADIAAESANMTKQNTMMQAGITVLSQANQMPSMVSQLLR
ncbi:flagellin [Grimontia hollisae]|uniref:Flagellin n=1 Tax=Grimontia hollisae CIP 101886 TaxID=675812 RepID=D0I430_GRIHO|nr:flagellin [Grimontia hollisae]AMG30480.1 flagellin [Grimontia hollisae]EEY73808.1 flagellin protein flaB [Grimontia hollisae CIP 101886]STO41925.1 B-type flagellin [Grimontia hollisae]